MRVTMTPNKKACERVRIKAIPIINNEILPDFHFVARCVSSTENVLER